MSTVIASKGFKVFGVEVNKEKCLLIGKGKAPFFEPKVNDLLEKTIGNQFEVTSNLKDAVLQSDVIFVCVGTPSRQDGSIDLTFIKNISHEIGEILKHSKDFKVIVIKSTISPTTTDKIVKPILENTSLKKSGVDFGLCMNPEFLKEGTAVDDMLNPHLVVIGSEDEKNKKNHV